MPKKDTAKTSARSSTKKTTVSRRKSQSANISNFEQEEPIVQNLNIQPNMDKSEFNQTSKPNKNYLSTAIKIIVVLLALGYFLRSWFLVALVNNRPIFRQTLNKQMEKAVGNDILENMIVEELVKQEARKQQVTVTEADVDGEAEKITKTLGAGVTLEDALKFQGMNLEEFREQLRIRLMVNQILSKEVSVSAEEVDSFLKDNAKSLVATSEAEKRTEAESKLRDQKLSERIQTWVKELQDRAKINRFLN